MTHPGPPIPRIALLSLGCAKNLVDSEHIASVLAAAGVEVTADPAGADAAVVNTCGFIDPAKQESIDTILDVAELKGAGRLRALVVTGCLSQRYGAELADELPEVDVFVGIGPERAARAALTALGLRPPAHPCHPRECRLTPAAWAYLRIAEGCDNRCAYCAIPLIRGPLRSRAADEIVDEALFLLAGGVRELNVIAQDTTAYGRDTPAGPQLHALLRRLCALPGEKWVRLLYAHPAHFYPELIDVLAGEADLCPYLDVPLQHIADGVLERMGRRVRRAEVEDLIGRLRERIPGLTLRTTFLVGFPGETDADFEELLDFVRATRFERLGAFAYSEEEGTRAAGLEGQIPQDVREERYDVLMATQQQIALELAAARVGERTQVLVETAASDDGPAAGRSPHEAPDVDPVILIEDADALAPGDVGDVEIVGSDGYDCVARVRAR